jgi:tRNA(Met) C34 N-acetyltransferase TmcA
MIGQQFQDQDFPRLSGARIVRIAAHPEAFRAGYGSKAVKELEKYFVGGYLGALAHFYKSSARLPCLLAIATRNTSFNAMPSNRCSTWIHEYAGQQKSIALYVVHPTIYAFSRRSDEVVGPDDKYNIQGYGSKQASKQAIVCMENSLVR